MTSFLQKTREKDVVGIVTFDLIGLLTTNHVSAYISMAYRSLKGNVFKQRKIFEISSSESRVYLQEMANFGDHSGDFRV